MNAESTNSDAGTNIAGRLGAWSARHWKRATFGWLALAAAAMLLGTAVGAKEITDSEMASGETARALRMLEDAGFEEPATESVLVQSKTERVGDPRFQSVVTEVVRFLALQKNVAGIQNPFEHPASQISRDRHSVLVQFDIAGDADSAADKVQPILDGVAAIQRHQPDYVVEQFGSASVEHVLAEALGEDFRRAETLSVPITLVILLLAFGALVAAGIPVLLAFSAVLASVGLSQLASHVFPSADATQSVILLMGMAVGVDYSLFYLRREREERARGRAPHAALLRTAATSGQAVLVSGATVLVAMAGMLFAGNALFTSIGIGTMIVIFAAIVGSLTVLPALLHKLGDRVEKGKVPVIARFRRPAGESRMWGAILRPVLRYPLVFALLSAGALAAAAVPVLGMHTKLSGFTDFPKSLPMVATFDRIQAAFPGSQTPAEVVVKADNVTTPAYVNAYGEFRRRALATGLLYRPFHVHVSPDETVARVEFAIAGSGDDDASMKALDALRNDVIPAVAGDLPDTEVAVSGMTAGTRDFNELMKQRAPLVFAFVLALAFVLLLLTFRSIIVPLKAIVLNLLSVGAAYGVLIMVFQWGNLEGALGFRSNGAIVSWLPLFLFVVLFGLSMDYHVFILSRIKELVDRGMKTEEAVDRGIRTTAGTVTAAAVVMVAVFAIFAGLRSLDVKQMGFGLAVAVLIDATVIRAVLLPATMKLLGDWNWYLPRWLEWLPRLGPEGRPTADGRPPVVAAAPDASPAGADGERRVRPPRPASLARSSLRDLARNMPRISALSSPSCRLDGAVTPRWRSTGVGGCQEAAHVVERERLEAKSQRGEERRLDTSLSELWDRTWQATTAALEAAVRIGALTASEGATRRAALAAERGVVENELRDLDAARLALRRLPEAGTRPPLRSTPRRRTPAEEAPPAGTRPRPSRRRQRTAARSPRRERSISPSTSLASSRHRRPANC